VSFSGSHPSKLGEESELYAHKIRIDAQTLLGGFLKQMAKNTGANGSCVSGGKRKPVKDTTPTLAANGISKTLSFRSQALHTAKEKAPALADVESIVSGVRRLEAQGHKGRITAKEAIAAAKEMPGQGARTDLKPRDNITKSKRGTSADYWSARIKRDHPAIAARMAAGEFRSVRAAAIAMPNSLHVARGFRTKPLCVVLWCANS